MIYGQRYCTVQGHETYIPSHICTSKECDQQSRRVCMECSVQHLHIHQQESQNHIKNNKDFIKLVTGHQINVPVQDLLNIIIKIQQIEQGLITNLKMISKFNKISQTLEKNLFKMENSQIQLIVNTIHDGQQINSTLLEQIKQLKDQVLIMDDILNNFPRYVPLGLKNQMSNELEQIDQQQEEKQLQQNDLIRGFQQNVQIQEDQQKNKQLKTDQDQLSDQLQNQLQNQQDILIEQPRAESSPIDSQQNKQFQSEQKQEEQQIVQANEETIQIKQYKFSKYCQYRYDWSIKSAQISPDEKYLAFGGDGKVVIIYDLRQKYLSQTLKIDQQVNVCQFSGNSQLLYVGTLDGYINCFDIKDGFKLLYSNNVAERAIQNIIELRENVIIVSSHDFIHKIIVQDGQIVKNKIHKSRILALEYVQEYDLIVSGAVDMFIKFSDQDLQTLFEKPDAHNNEIIQIQAIGNKLFSLDFGYVLKLWEVDYSNKQIIHVRSFKNEDPIVNFKYFSVDQILIICKSTIKTINENNEVLQELQDLLSSQNSQKAIFWVLQQLNSFKYIIVPEEKQITVMKQIIV